MTLEAAITELRRTMAGQGPDPGGRRVRARPCGGDLERRHPRQPAAIVRPTSAEDVARVVTAVRPERADLTVRGGGHSGAGKRSPRAR